MRREAFIDRSAGEERAVVLADGRPERLIIHRDSDITCQRLGATMTARVARIERGLSTAFVQLPEGRDAVLPAGPGVILAEGASIEVEIVAEPRRDKGAVVRLVGPSSGPPRLIADGPDLAARLAAAVPNLSIAEGPQARDAADLAQEEALATVHSLPGGGSIAIEPTRALTAIDVDLGARGAGDPARAARAANLAAIAEAARLLRLKGLSGLVVFDLAGKGQDGAAMTAAAKAAFAPDGAGVSLGPISRFGLFELAIPRTDAPIAERLTDESGRPTAETVALDLLRAVEREGRAAPGARLSAIAAPDVVAIARTHQSKLEARLGPRVVLKADAALPRARFEVLTQ